MRNSEFLGCVRPISRVFFFLQKEQVSTTDSQITTFGNFKMLRPHLKQIIQTLHPANNKAGNVQSYSISLKTNATMS